MRRGLLVVHAIKNDYKAYVKLKASRVAKVSTNAFPWLVSLDWLA